MVEEKGNTLALFPVLECVVQMWVFRRESELMDNYVKKDFERRTCPLSLPI